MSLWSLRALLSVQGMKTSICWPWWSMLKFPLPTLNGGGLLVYRCSAAHLLCLEGQNLCWGWWPVTMATCPHVPHRHPTRRPWVTVLSLFVSVILGPHPNEENCKLGGTPTCLLLFQVPFWFTFNTVMLSRCRIYKAQVKNSGRFFPFLLITYLPWVYEHGPFYFLEGESE